MHDLLVLLNELRRFVENRAANDQIIDLCSIVASEARELGNLRVVRGAEAIARRALEQYSSGRCFDRDLALREIEGMVNSLRRIRVF